MMNNMEKKVFCSLGGGLGNQLFEIFATISYAIKYNRDFLFTYETILPNCFIEYYRKTYWHDLLSSILNKTTYTNEYTNEYINNIPNCFIEGGFIYDEIPNTEENEILIKGHFQSYKYFLENYDKIYDILNFENIKTNIKNEYNFFFQENRHTISIHFRLGDYKLKPKQHPILAYTYYENSINTIMNIRQIYNPIILVCCEEEDNEYVTNVIFYLKNTNPYIDFMKIHDDIDDWKQMMLLSCCNDNIIANSTFSWWGAYLNNNNDKIVTYPSVWFGDPVPMNDFIPNNWIMIDY